MRLRWLATLLAALAGCGAVGQTDPLEWEELPPLPDPIGFAGPFAGVSGDALIVAGGANFPDGRPWEGSQKIWHDRIFVLTDTDGDWIEAETRLPARLAYGVSLPWNDKVVCVGGGDADTHARACFTIGWDGEAIAIEPLPDLPQPVAFATGAILDDIAYVFGGIDRPDAAQCLHTTYGLDLAAPPAERSWRALDPWPGPERYLAVAGAQSGVLVLAGGIQLEAGADGSPSRIKPFLSDTYVFAPDGREGAGAWRSVADMPSPLAAAPSPAMAAGPSHLLVFGGDDGSLTGDLRDAHPGFEGGVLAYHTITDTWAQLGTMPRSPGPDPANDPASGVWPPVTTVATEWRGRLVIPTGEARPGVRTSRVQSATLRPRSGSFGVLNYAALVVYLGSLLLMGVYFSRREKTTDDFFLAGRRVPWWAAGLSIFGTQLSAITFLALPAKTYATDWLYFIQNLGIIAIAPLIVVIYVPFYRRLNVTTAYEYLEQRFNIAVRMLGAVAFLAFQMARMGIVVFLPALALAAVTGMDISLCILLMGVMCTTYTYLGGIEAVVWTDVLQVIVLLGGALLALIVVVLDAPNGAGGMIETAGQYGKLRVADLSWDWTTPAIGVILLGAVFNNLVPYSSDQAVVQRYLTTRDEKRAKGAVWAGALLSFPASLLFFGMGTALFLFYRDHPERLNPAAPNDQVFAWFIVNELPAGAAGLVIAGVFAAAMSSLDSSMNAMSAVVTTDFYRRFGAQKDEHRCMRVAKSSTLVFGVLGTGSALLMAQLQINSLFDQFIAFVGLLGGTMAGLFALGMLSRRASTGGALIGAGASAAALVFVKTQTDLSGLLYATVGMVVCFVAGWIGSMLLPGKGAGPGLSLQTRTQMATGEQP